MHQLPADQPGNSYYKSYRREPIPVGTHVWVADEHHALVHQSGKVVAIDTDGALTVRFEVNSSIDKAWYSIKEVKEKYDEMRVLTTTELIFHRQQLTTDGGR